MHLKLKDQKLKTVLFVYRPLYQNFMETTNPKSTIDEKKKSPQRKAIQNNTKVSYQITRDKNKRRKKTYKKKSKTINKMAIRTYILIITLNINGLNVPTEDRDCLS